MRKYMIHLSIIMIFLLSTPLLSKNKMRIAVMDLKGIGVSQRTAKTASNMIRNKLINTRKFTVIERSQMSAILEEQGLQQTGCTDEACAVEMGRLLSALDDEMHLAHGRDVVQRVCVQHDQIG